MVSLLINIIFTNIVLHLTHALWNVLQITKRIKHDYLHYYFAHSSTISIEIDQFVTWRRLSQMFDVDEGDSHREERMQARK